MHTVLVMGAGEIGSVITFLLTRSQRYVVYLADLAQTNPCAQVLANLPHCHYVVLNANDTDSIDAFVKKNHIEAVISSLPYFCNLGIAKIAAAHGLPYFDLTEDVQTTQALHDLAKTTNSAFIPQCGLAPGFISIITHHLLQHFPTLHTVKMCVGALPLNISNALQYALTWSTDGLINEYGNPCQAIEDGKLVTLQPLENLEQLKIDGLTYEAFNTSGGVGSLIQSYLGKVKQLSYKTIRYPGHCEKIKFLMNDLKLNQDRKVLKHILEQVIPKTYQDVVLIYVSVTGIQDKHFIEESYVKKFYSQKIDHIHWSAIQLATGSGLCAVVDLTLQHPELYHGFVLQEQFSYDKFIHNEFGSYFT